MPIVHKNGSLFEAPRGSVLVHAVNAQGIWGSGIAKQFAAKFPQSYEMYKLGCQDEDATGLGIILPDEAGYRIGCLFTSTNYGDKKDSPETILKNTRSALEMMFSTFFQREEEIHSCKFNSGLFNVPWEETEKILVEVMDEVGYTKPWTIWSI